MVLVDRNVQFVVFRNFFPFFLNVTSFKHFSMTHGPFHWLAILEVILMAMAG